MSHQAKKRFGQHFLHDTTVIDRLVRAINPQHDDQMVEIGPGLGALTLPLLAHLQHLQVVELDRDVIPHLQRACAAVADRLQITEADALSVDYRQFRSTDKPLRLVGNLPYNISTPLLFHLLSFTGEIADMHFMLQKEVVDRMCAAPDDDAYGRLTVALAARAECLSLFDVPPSSFSPPPKVDSAIVRVIPRKPDFTIHNLDSYDRVVAVAFSQRRKTLSNGLKSLMSADQIRAAGVDPQKRAETLAPATFADLANVLFASQQADHSMSI